MNRRLPGDGVVLDARLVMDRLLDLTGTPDVVWPWLEQLGKKRAGWYLPRAVERLEVLEIDAPHHLVYWSERERKAHRGVARPPVRMTWALVLTEHGPSSSQLHLRLRVDLGHTPGPVATYGGGAMDWATVKLLGLGLNERLREVS